MTFVQFLRHSTQMEKHLRLLNVIVCLCYKADRARNGVSVRRGASVRKIVAKSSGRESGPSKRP